MTEIPAPLTPADCDLRDFSYMPLIIQRLKASRQWLICKRKPELAFYLTNMWTASWHEVPAASIENDEDVLADKAMCPPDKWETLRADLMRGWILCSDGRWYHPTIAERACESWEAKCKARDERETERLRKAAKRAAERGETPRNDRNLSGEKPDLSAGLPAENALKGSKGKGSKEKTLSLVDERREGEREIEGSSPKPLIPPSSEFEDFIRAYPPVPNESKAKALKAWEKIRAPRPEIEMLLACVAAYRAHIDEQNSRRKPDDPFRVCLAATWLNERRWEGFLEAAEASQSTARAAESKRHDRIPAGAWADAAERFAGAHGWRIWDNAVHDCRLVDEDPLRIEYPTSWAMSHAKESGLFEKLRRAAGAELQAGVRQRPMAAE